jgi:hypothetical protein
MNLRPEAKQVLWDVWLTISFTLLIVLIILGTLEGIDVFLSNWSVLFYIATVNLFAAIIVGLINRR